MDSSEGRKYPPRLYEEGKSPLQHRSMVHYCQLQNFISVRDSIGPDAWNAIKELSIGIIAKLVDSHYVWSAKTAHYLLTRQLAVRKNEIWSVVGGQPIRFSLHEFAEITGLSTGPLPTEKCVANYTDFWKELGVPAGQGPKYDEMVKVLGTCRAWSFEKRKMLGLLFILHIGIYGLHHNSRLPLEIAKRVFRDEDIENFPWGRVAFDCLVRGVKVVQYEKKSYTVNGCVHALVFWAYESVKVFGERFGKVIDNTTVPFLRWGGNRTRSSLETVICEEIQKHREVRVRRMIKKPVDEIYPQWEAEDDDPELDNLIMDVLEDKFDQGYWDSKKHDKQLQVAKKVDVVLERPRKRFKVGGRDYERKASDVRGNEDHEDFQSKESVIALVNLVERLSGRFDDMESNIGGMIGGIERRIEDRLEEKLGVRVTFVEDRLGNIESELKLLRDRLAPHVDENSMIVRLRQEEDEVNSPVPPTEAAKGVVLIDLENKLEHAIEKGGNEVAEFVEVVGGKGRIGNGATKDNDQTVSPGKLGRVRGRSAVKRKTDKKDEKQEEKKERKKQEKKDEKKEEKKGEKEGERKGEKKREKKEEKKEENKEENKEEKTKKPIKFVLGRKKSKFGDDSEIKEITQQVLDQENQLLPESDGFDNEEERIKTARVKEYIAALQSTVDAFNEDGTPSKKKNGLRNLHIRILEMD